MSVSSIIKLSLLAGCLFAASVKIFASDPIPDPWAAPVSAVPSRSFTIGSSKVRAAMDTPTSVMSHVDFDRSGKVVEYQELDTPVAVR